MAQLEIRSKTAHDVLIIEKYILEKGDVEHLKPILDAVHSVSSTSIRIAIARFNRLYARANEEDRIIDAVVALEALYLVGIKDELKFRMAVRVAAHMGGTDAAERERLFTLASTAYNLRSDLVHGSLGEAERSKDLRRSSWETPSGLLEALTDLLRNSLKSVLLDIGEQQFKQCFHKELDSSIVQARIASFSG